MEWLLKASVNSHSDSLVTVLTQQVIIFSRQYEHTPTWYESYSDLVNKAIILDLSGDAFLKSAYSAVGSSGMILMKLELQIQFPSGLIRATQKKKKLQIFPYNFIHPFSRYTEWEEERCSLSFFLWMNKTILPPNRFLQENVRLTSSASLFQTYF